MKIELNEKEKNLQKAIVERMGKVQKLLADYRLDDDVQKLIEEMGKDAHELHMSLDTNGHTPQHHEYMIKNRGFPPEKLEFYMHVHPVEDLLAYIEDENANKDPQDQTIGEMFDFRVYSRRWGHDDIYHFMRTKDGWDVNSPPIGGSCDKGGDPHLFKNLRQDLIHYPIGLNNWLEWLWEQAASKGLSKDEVQIALQELADWISITEKNAPSSKVWENYCKTEKSIKTGVITFLDVLGWKGVYVRKTDAIATLKKFIEEIHIQANVQRGRVKYNEKVVEVRSISDTIILITPCLESDASIAIDIHGKLCKWIIPRSINLEIPVRGATAFGEFEYDPEDNIYVGKAIDEAATWHELADWIGVNLTPSAEYIFKNQTDDTCWVQYQPPIKAIQGLNLYCVNWTKDWDDREKKIEGIKTKFCRLGPLVPEIAGKYANTLKFIEVATEQNK